MNNKTILTSIIALGFVCPAMAVSWNDTGENKDLMSANTTYEGAATVEHMYVSENSDVATAAAYYDIDPGYYLPAGEYLAQKCPGGGVYCPGVTQVTKSSSAQVLENCPSGYSSTDSGAKSKADCYKSCPSSIANAKNGTSITGKGVYYGNLNNCEPNECASGYDKVPTLNIVTMFGGKTGSIDSSISSDEYLWGVSFNNGLYVKGAWDCNTNRGTMDIDEWADSYEEGPACYCWLGEVNGYAAKSLAVVARTFNDTNTCQSSCQQACANMVINGAAASQFGELVYSTITDKCTAHTYTYSFTCGEGGTGTPPTGGTIKYGQDFSFPSTEDARNCQKTGYEFQGWTDSNNNNFNANHYGNWDFSDSETKVFGVRWSPKRNTITLNANGAADGQINNSSLTNGATTFTCYTNNSMYLPTWGSGTTIYKPGKIFLGWSEDSACTSTTCVANPTTCPTGDKTYYAVWADASCTSGGTGVANTEYESVVDNAPSCYVTCNPGYSDNGGVSNVTSGFTRIGEAGVAAFKPDCKKNSIFEISLDSKKYSSTSDTTGTAATTAGAPATVYLWYGNGWYSNAAATTPISKMTTRPKLDGSVFTGYYKNKTATGTTFVNAAGTFSASETTGYNTNGTMYADYTECSCTNGQNVASCSATGTNQNNQCTYTYTCNPGYHTGNSGTTATGTFTGSANTASNQSPNCNANTITLNWANGGHGTNPTTPASCTYGSTFTMPAALTDTGYTFNRWNVNSKTFTAGQTSVACTSANLGVTTGSATITASWTKNKIYIVWDNVKVAAEGMTFDSENATAQSEVYYDESITTPTTAETRTGQKFRGWKFVNPNNNSGNN